MEEMKAPLQQKSSPLVPRASTLNLDKAIEHELKHGRKMDPNMDTRKLRRTISNRLSAQRSRIKKAHYINDMEKMINDLEELISVLTPQIDSYKEGMTLMIMQNDSLRKLIEIRTKESYLSEIELERKQAEVCRLRDLENALKMKRHHHHHHHQQKTTTFVQLAEPKTEPNCGYDDDDEQEGFRFKLPIEALAPVKINQEEEIDQYINYEQLYVDQANNASE